MNDAAGEFDSDINRELRIEAICERYEEAWRSGRRPEIAACLEEIEAPGRSELVQELVTCELQWRRQQGEAPRVEEYTVALREYATQVKAAFGRSRTI
ncbi:MAG: hypothetical protein FJ276_12740 [Planctomycetes bacterium]|nr:hypothetical protein [Planctomycetota bacterium]